jgi:hypothetical protein
MPKLGNGNMVARSGVKNRNGLLSLQQLCYPAQYLRATPSSKAFGQMNVFYFIFTNSEYLV